MNSTREFPFEKNSLIITSSGAKSRGWLDYLNIKDFQIFDSVEPNPSMETVEKILSEYNQTFSSVIGLGGGSSLDVAKFVANKLKTKKILIPTTFGSGSEVTRISVLQIDGKKTSFHNNDLFADISIVDPYFIKGAPFEIIKNSAIDACAQATEAYDSKLTNSYTKLLCEKAFDILENSILNQKYEQLPLGSLICGLGFGNSSTTLGHALSYVYSNEGISHGHALAFTTAVAHKFNNSIFYDRFLKVVKKLQFTKISLKQDIHEASETILLDKKHLDNNPQKVTGKDVEKLLNIINEGF
jgi:succinate semialdehyde reductase